MPHDSQVPNMDSMLPEASQLVMMNLDNVTPPPELTGALPSSQIPGTVVNELINRSKKRV